MSCMKDILFGLPIYRFHIDPTSYNKKHIIKLIENNHRISAERNKWDKRSKLHHGYNDFNNKKFKKINFEKLNEIYRTIFTKFCTEDLNLTKNFKINFDIKNYTAVKKDQYMASHQHLVDCDFSAVHYVQFPKGSSPITFFSHNDFGEYLQFLRPDYYKLANNQNLDNSYLYARFKYTPIEDEIVIFPAVLMHEIEKQITIPKLRISVVVNLTIEKNEND